MRVREAEATRPNRPEQRAAPRRGSPVRCWAGDGTIERFASLADISRDGARLYTALPPAPGEIIDLRFRLAAAGAEVHAQARVVWRAEGPRGRGGVIGVSFIAVEGIEEIARYVGEG
jgi:hypothetical protein